MAQRSLQLVHHHPGRIRLRASAFRGDGSTAERVRAALSELPAVRTVSLDAFTGSVLVDYEPGIVDPEAVLKAALAAGGFSSIEDRIHPSGDARDPVASVIRIARGLNAAIGEATGSRADLRLLFPVGLFGAGLFSLLRRPLLPRWDNLLIWSLQLFLSLNADQIRGDSEAGR